MLYSAPTVRYQAPYNHDRTNIQDEQEHKQTLDTKVKDYGKGCTNAPYERKRREQQAEPADELERHGPSQSRESDGIGQAAQQSRDYNADQRLPPDRRPIPPTPECMQPALRLRNARR